MRELPEPDGAHDRVFERGTVVYTKESVLAIQKQAYEDGLRDAIPDGYVLMPTEATVTMMDTFRRNDLSGFGPDFFGAYRAMLTASQEKK